MFTVLAGPTVANKNSSGPPAMFVTTASQIRSMTIEQAKQRRPVRLTGVITYYDPEEPDLFIQDSSGGIWVNLEVPGQQILHLQDGDTVFEAELSAILLGLPENRAVFALDEDRLAGPVQRDHSGHFYSMA
jgi:hypothetical protein